MRTMSGRVRIRQWLARTKPDDYFLSVITLGEIQRGVEKLRPDRPVDAATLETWLTQVRLKFSSRLLAVDEASSLAWGRMPLKVRGNTSDALIAATAVARGLIVVTRNVKDFEGLGVSIVNPFESAT